MGSEEASASPLAPKTQGAAVPATGTDLDHLCVNTLRALSIDTVQKANSGHPGLPLGAAPMAYVLWSRHLRFDPHHPAWPDRDRFVLSGGHGSALLYALIHLFGYDLSLDDLKAFRQWGSRTPGHPEAGHTPGVEVTTGPLGQGAANAVGLAVAEAWQAARYTRPAHEIVHHRTFALVTDGDLMEGLSQEAASLAGHLGLGHLVCLYDSNHVCLDGPTSETFTEDVGARYEALGWHVQRVEDGDHDLDAIDRAITAAVAVADRPSLIVVQTTIGYGSPAAGSHKAHGAPLGAKGVARTKIALGLDPERDFHEPPDVVAHCGTAIDRGADLLQAWEGRFHAWSEAHPELAREWRLAQEGELPEGWDADLPGGEPGQAMATRVAGGKVLATLSGRIPWLLALDADLSSSTKVRIPDSPDFSREDRSGRNIRCGVREHAMAAIANGLAHHGGIVPVTSTFFCFSDYMRPAIRLAALDRLRIVYVWTHDSIGVGEDGPTHQPIAQLAALRAMPRMTVLRPADSAETAEAWRAALTHRGGPVGLVLSRQDLPVLDRTVLGSAGGLARGAYVLAEAGTGEPEAIIIATGSEVCLALSARARLEGEGIGVRVVSMPGFEFFAAQDQDCRDAVLPPAVTARVSVEAGSTFGWDRWTGSAGVTIGSDRFGASAPGEEVFEQLGLTPDHVVAAVRRALGR